MKKLILDSGIVSAYMNRRDDVFERLQAEVRLGARIGTCVPIVAEIAFGIELSTSRDRNMAIFQRNLQSLTVWPFDERSAFSYGVIAAELRKIGRPMQTMDMMFALQPKAPSTGELRSAEINPSSREARSKSCRIAIGAICVVRAKCG